MQRGAGRGVDDFRRSVRRRRPGVPLAEQEGYLAAAVITRVVGRREGAFARRADGRPGEEETGKGVNFKRSRIRRKSLRQRNLIIRFGRGSLRQRNLIIRFGCGTLRQQNLTIRSRRRSLRQRNLIIRFRRRSLRQRSLIIRFGLGSLHLRNVAAFWHFRPRLARQPG